MNKVYIYQIITVHTNRGNSRALVRMGTSYNFTKSYNKKKTTIFSTQIQVIYF
jgi:hypothetical protein